MKHKNLRNRLLSLVCTGALALSLLPGSALAAGAAAPAETRNEGGTYNGNWAIPVRSLPQCQVMNSRIRKILS